MIGLLAGAMAGRVVSGHGYGITGDLVIGIAGALLGGWLFGVFLGGAGTGFFINLFAAFAGAVALLLVIRVIVPARR